jgi:Xaa-Pro aminopeptidase
VDFAALQPGPAPQIPREAFAARRTRLAHQLGHGSTLVVATHPTHTFSNDVDYVFRPHSDFWYLTGFAEPHAALVLEGGSGRSTLFLQPRRKEAEIWTGRRLGIERAVASLAVDAAHDIADLGSRLPGILGKDRVHAVAGHEPAVQRRIARAAGRRLLAQPPSRRPGGPQGSRLKRRAKTEASAPTHARDLLAEMRLIKDGAELRLLQKACDLGVQAHLRAAAAVAPGATEYQVEAAFGHHARHHGSTGPGYPSICGCGPNAAVLHYIANRDRLRRGRLFLVDAGCEWGYYTSDITRTYPVGGGFTRLQGHLYDLVLAAHQAGLRKVRPGNPFRAPHEAAVDILVAGLLDLGYLEGSHEKAVKEQTYRRHFMHGTSHFLGLDVHDVGSTTEADGSPRKLRQGMVLTVEPGLYFNPDFAPCPPEAEGIGIRIEDDVAVTGDGRRVLSRALPVAPDAVSTLVPNRR